MVPFLLFLSAVALLQGVQSSTDDSSGSFLNNVILESAVDVYTLKSSAARLKDGCRKQSENYFYALKNQSEWALQMYDASSKLQPGIITGHLVDLGSFDECLAVKATTDVGRVTGKYCLATITYKGNNNSEGQLLQDDNTLLNLYILAKKELSHTIARNMKQINVESKWSICVPDACSHSDVEAHLAAIFQNFTVNVHRNDCQTLIGQPKMSTEGWSYIFILLILVATLVLSTIYDINLRKKGQKPTHGVLLAFSVYTNGEKLTAIRRGIPGHMGCLDGIRFISAAWVVLVHRHDQYLRQPLLNELHTIKRYSTLENSLYIGSCLVVDTFLLMSGCLMMQSFLRSKAKGVSLNIPRQILHRYLRLTPVVAATVAFFATLLIFIGSGPLWLTNISKEQHTCRKYWWSALLYVQNYVNPDEMCMTPLWYLCVDMHLFIVSLVLFAVIWWKWEKYALHAFVSLTIIFMIIPFSVTYIHEIPLDFYKTKLAIWWPYYYCSTITRAAPWFVGLALGHILYFNSKRPSKLVLSKWVVGACWILAAVGSFCAVNVEYPINQLGYRHNQLFESTLHATHRTVWSIAVSWLIFACVNGYGGPINTFLSLPVFQILGRFSYCIYVTHYTLMVGFQNTKRTPYHFSNINVIYSAVGDLCFAILIAGCCVLLFEMPAVVIDSFLCTKDTKKPIVKEQNQSAPTIKLEIDNPGYVITEKL